MNCIPAPQENWTKFPNAILDNLPQYTGNELKILAWMIRQNLGHQKANYRFSIAYLMKNTGLSRQTVVSSLKNLRESGAIIEVEANQKTGNEYRVNWGVQKLDRSKNQTAGGLKNRPPVVQKLDRLKETIQRNNTKKTAAAGDGGRVHADLMNFAHELHVNLTGQKPDISGKDGACLKRLIAKHGPELCAEMAGRLYDLQKTGKCADYFRCGVGWSAVSARWNSLAALNTESKRGAWYEKRFGSDVNGKRNTGIAGGSARDAGVG